MMHLCLADTVIIIHALFILFVMLGGWFVYYRRRWIWLHIPAVTWGALVELMDWTCPLTYLEKYFRSVGGGETYGFDFIGRYLMPIIYPDALTRGYQIMLGLSVMLCNVIIYSVILYRKHLK